MRGRRRREPVQNFSNDDVVRFVTAFDRHVSLCINRIASLDEFLHRGFGITVAQQRARVAFHHPAHQDRQLCPKPDRNAVFPHALARLGVHVGAAAGREHLRSVAEQARNDLALAVAETALLRDRRKSR